MRRKNNWTTVARRAFQNKIVRSRVWWKKAYQIDKEADENCSIPSQADKDVILWLHFTNNDGSLTEWDPNCKYSICDDELDVCKVEEAINNSNFSYVCQKYNTSGIPTEVESNEFKDNDNNTCGREVSVEIKSQE